MIKIFRCLLTLILALLIAGNCGAGNIQAGAKASAADELLTGTWSVRAIGHVKGLFDIYDVDGLADMYDAVFLDFREDGTFYYFNHYSYTGSYTPFKENTYLLKIESIHELKIKDNEFILEKVDVSKQTTYLIQFVGDQYTLVFGRLDPISGKIKADDTPMYFEKDGFESAYISQRKVKVESTSKPDKEPTVQPSTAGEWSALRRAKAYLELMPFSYEGLIEQLEFEGFSHSNAVYGADNCGVSWYDQATKHAKQYLKSMPFSYEGLISQLEYEGYSSQQAIYGVNNCEADWYRQAARHAKQYLELMSFSRSELIEQLEYEGYTHDEAVYGAEQNGY